MGSKTATSSGNSTSSGSSTTTLSPQVQAAYNALLGQIGNLSSGTNTSTGAAANGLSNLAANSNANYGSAANTLGSAATPAYQSISDYLSPFLTSGLSALQASQGNQNAQQQQQLVGNAISQGALGGNRVAVAQSNLAGQQALANNATNAAFVNNAYQQAENSALQGQSNQTAAGSAQAGLGSAQNASTLSNLLGLLSAGNSQYANLGTLGSLASNLSNSGATVSNQSQSTGTSTVPTGNTFSSLLGLGTTLAGLFAEGGTVPKRYDVGGSISELAQSANAGMDQSQQFMQSLMQNAQSAATQQQQQPQYTDEQKKGAQNIGNWVKGVIPQNDNAMPVMYAGGGVVPFRRRGYDDGGYVDFPYADFGDTNSQIVNAPAGVVPALVGDSGVTVPSSYTESIDRAGSHGLPTLINQVAPQPGVLSNPALLRDTPTDNPATRQMTRDQAMADQGFPAPGVVPAVARTGPLTVATNNPGAITAGPWAASQPGYAGTRGNFAVFDSPEAGRAAQVGLLNSYADRGYNTISSVINRWSPQSANAPGSTAHYIDYVSQRTGIAPNQPIPPDRMGDVAQAQSEWESGVKPGFTPPAPGGVVPSAEGGAGMGTPAIASPAVSGVIPTQYGIPDSNAGYATNLGDVLKSLQAGKGLDLSPDARMALISAGAGIMGGTSPNAFANIGSGIQQGLNTWQAKQQLNRENALAQSGIGAQQGELGLEGQKVQQAGQQLYLNAQQTAAQIAQETAEAAKANVEAGTSRYTVTPTGAGVMIVDRLNPTAGAQLIPYDQMSGQGVGNPAPGASSPDTGTPPSPAATSDMGAGPSDAEPNASSQPMAPVGSIPSRIPIDGRLMTPVGQQIVAAETNGALSDARTKYQAAQAADLQLQEMQHDLATVGQGGWATQQGSLFPQRIQFARAVNSALESMGQPPLFDPAAVGAGEDLNKLTTRFGQDLARALGSGEAASIVQGSIAAVPGGVNSPAGAQRIISGIKAANARNSDYYDLLQSWSAKTNGSIKGFDDWFARTHPPELYAIRSYVPQGAIEYLRSHPEAAGAFDQKYGNGQDIAQYVLGAQ